MIPIFGYQRNDIAPRQSAFVVIADGHGRIAVVVESPGFLSLPGGGLEEGEDAKEAALREVWEECGWRVRLAETLGTALQYLEVKPFAKSSSFFRAFISSGEQGPAEKEVLWLAPGEVHQRLFEESHAWAVDQASGGS